MRRQELLTRLAQRNERRIVLLVLDGVGDLRTAPQPRTALDEARTPNLDRLAARSALGRLVPAGTGITPGSGPGHLALFGYEPTSPGADIGRGVLGGARPGPGLPARGGRGAGQLRHRRRGRSAPATGAPAASPSAEGERICALLARRIEAAGGLLGDGVHVEVHPGEAYRFVLLFRAVAGTPPLDPGLLDTDPQQLGVPPLPLEAAAEPGGHGGDGGNGEAARDTARRIAPAVEALQAGACGTEERANTFLLRGFSRSCRHCPASRRTLRCARGRPGRLSPLPRRGEGVRQWRWSTAASPFDQLIDRLEDRFGADFDFFFLHVKGTDMAGEDGDLAAKAGGDRVGGRAAAASARPGTLTCWRLPATTRPRRR